MALKVNLYKNKNQNSTKFGRVYARVKNSQPIGISELAQHMSEHNTPYSKGVIRGILTDMASCIKELILMGQPVKIADLAIFSAEVTSDSATTADKFDLQKHIKDVRLLAKSTGIVTRKELSEDALLEYTEMAQRIRSGEVKLSNEKGKYLEGVEQQEP